MQSVELYIYEEEIFYSGEVTGNIGDKYRVVIASTAGAQRVTSTAVSIIA